MKSYKRIEIGKGYGKKITIDIADVCGEYEVIAMNEEYDDLDLKMFDNLDDAFKYFDELVEKYAGKIQKLIYGANLEIGKKYTLVYCDEVMGFPVARQITLESVSYKPYAQYDDNVTLEYKLKRHRKYSYMSHFHRSSFTIFEGWKQVPDSVIWETVSENSEAITRRSKYMCFDARYMEDVNKVMKNPVVIYDGSVVGVDGRKYA